MDMEQLKMILDLFGTVTGQAKEVAIWYFVLHFVMEMIGKLGFALAVGAICYTGYRIALLVKESQDDGQWIRQIRDAMFPNYGGYVSRSEVSEIITKIHELKTKNK